MEMNCSFVQTLHSHFSEDLALKSVARLQAVCRVYLRELQEETGLTDDALRHIALISGKR